MPGQLSTDSCANCGKRVHDLKACDKCHTTLYCSRDCKKKHHKAHKKICAADANAHARSTRSRSFHTAFPAPGGTYSRATNFHVVNDPDIIEDFQKRDMLHKEISENKVFDLLVDIWRMRIADEWNFKGEVIIDSPLCEGTGDDEADALRGFKSFLGRVENAAPEVLPDWWSKEKKQACLRRADDTRHWSNVHVAIEKADIQEHYGFDLMPWKIRVMAEKIYGQNPWDY